MIRFNSVNPELFSVNSGEFSGSEKERAYIVTCGRALMMDRNGRDTNALRVLEKRGAEYTPMMADTGENSYAETNRNLQKRMMLFAAKMACSNTGEVAPADYGEFQRRRDPRCGGPHPAADHFQRPGLDGGDRERALRPDLRAGRDEQRRDRL